MGLGLKLGRNAMMGPFVGVMWLQQGSDYGVRRWLGWKLFPSAKWNNHTEWAPVRDPRVELAAFIFTCLVRAFELKSDVATGEGTMLNDSLRGCELNWIEMVIRPWGPAVSYTCGAGTPQPKNPQTMFRVQTTRPHSHTRSCGQPRPIKQYFILSQLGILRLPSSNSKFLKEGIRNLSQLCITIFKYILCNFLCRLYYILINKAKEFLKILYMYFNGKWAKLEKLPFDRFWCRRSLKL